MSYAICIVIPGYSIILAIFRHDREALIGNEIQALHAKSCVDLSSAKFLDPYLS